jgi:DNA-directed RNA polymerase I subunit RPA1
MCRPPLPQLHLDGKSRTPPTAFGEKQEEHLIVFRYGELLCGVLDKNAMGNASMGIVHAVYEIYGPELAGLLLTSFGRLFTYYLQIAGHTCGIEDLVLTESTEKTRAELLQKVSHRFFSSDYFSFFLFHLIY